MAADKPCPQLQPSLVEDPNDVESVHFLILGIFHFPFTTALCGEQTFLCMGSAFSKEVDLP